MFLKLALILVNSLNIKNATTTVTSGENIAYRKFNLTCLVVEAKTTEYEYRPTNSVYYG